MELLLTARLFSPRALLMHLPGCAPAMADGSFSLAGHLLRSPGGSASRLHSIEAILGFTKDDGILGAFPAERSTRGVKERDRRLGVSPTDPKEAGEDTEPRSVHTLEYDGKCAPRLVPKPRSSARQQSWHLGAGMRVSLWQEQSVRHSS